MNADLPQSPIDDRARTRDIVFRLEQWYAGAQRAMPWRLPPVHPATVSPATWTQRGYVALVSELMLQQTQVARVLDAFDRFMLRFPSVRALADASEDDVLATWQGLGYYRRARLLHAAARTIVDEHDGTFPTDLSSILSLPGVGRYTAGAIASTAFGQRAPIVDGNVARVVSRLDMIDGSPQSTATSKALWQRAEQFVDACSDPSAFNQSLMELGATVCTPRGPRCDACPVQSCCRAFGHHAVDAYPTPKKPPVRTVVHCASFAIEWNGLILLHKRDASGMWANMWQTPTLESTRTIRAASRRKFIRETLGLNRHTIPDRSAGVFVHETTHRRIHFSVWHVTLAPDDLALGDGMDGGAEGPIEGADRTWVRLEDLGSFALSNAQCHVLALALADRCPAMVDRA